MSDTENILEESVLQCGEQLRQLSCGIYIELSIDNDLECNVIWNEDNDLAKLATLINAVTTTNLIETQLEQMETDSPQQIETIRKYLSHIKSRPVISPLEVCRNASKGE